MCTVSSEYVLQEQINVRNMRFFLKMIFEIDGGHIKRHRKMKL